MKTARRASPVYALCAIGAILVAITIAACGSSRGFDDGAVPGDGSGADGGGGTLGPGFGNGQKAVTSIAIDPATASLTVESGGPV
ncbi:MAG TPA: hypothetical protein VIF62_06830, partial [Labilithrix sp.]